MPFRRFRRFSGVRRRPTKYFWIRDSVNNVSPVQGPSINTIDLMSGFRSSEGGFLFEFPNWTIWRLRIKISVGFKFSLTTSNANTGVFVGIATEDRLLTLNSWFTNDYSHKFMMWDEMYASEGIEQGQFTPTIDTTSQHYLYKEYDIKTHRKFENLNDTLFLQLIGLGNSTLTDYSVTHSLLMRGAH